MMTGNKSLKGFAVMMSKRLSGLSQTLAPTAHLKEYAIQSLLSTLKYNELTCLPLSYSTFL